MAQCQTSDSIFNPTTVYPAVTVSLCSNICMYYCMFCSRILNINTRGVIPVCHACCHLKKNRGNEKKKWFVKSYKPLTYKSPPAHPTWTFSLFKLHPLLLSSNNDVDGFTWELVKRPLRLLQTLKGTTVCRYQTPMGTDQAAVLDAWVVRLGWIIFGQCEPTYQILKCNFKRLHESWKWKLRRLQKETVTVSLSSY